MHGWFPRALIGLLVAFVVACGGGGGGGGGGGDGTPVIRAWLAVFPPEFIPPTVLAAGGNSLLLVSVSDVTPANASGTVVEANGRALTFDAGSGAWRGGVEVSTRQRLSLTVSRGAQRWTIGTDLIDVHPQLVAPRQRDSFPDDFKVTPDQVRGQPIRLAWTGELPSSDHRWAVMALDGLGQVSWPAADRFAVLDDNGLRRFELPAGAAGSSSSGYVAAGIARSVPIPGAGAGSTLTLAWFSMAELFLLASDPGIARLSIAPRWISVAVGRQQPLSALGYSNPATTGPTDLQDATNRVTWRTDDPAVAVVDADGMLRGVSAGTTTVRVASVGAGLGISAEAQVRVLPRRAATSNGDFTTMRADTAYSGAVSDAALVDARAAFPTAPRWTTALRGSLSYPLVGDGKVFVLALPWDGGVDSRLRLHALDLATGADAWAGPTVLSTFHRRGHMALEGRRLVVVTSDCDVSAFDTSSGSRLWTVNLASTLPFVWSCDSPPTVRNGIAHVLGTGVAGSPTALDLETGRILWSRRVSPGSGPMAVTDDAVYLGGLLQVIKLDAASGVVQWWHAGPGFGGGEVHPVLSGGRIYLDEPFDRESVVLDAGSGLLQSMRFSSLLPPAVASGLLFTSRIGGVSALRTDSASLAWSEATADFLRASPLVAGGALLVPLVDGRIEWRDAGSGQLWARTSTAPAVSTGGIELRPGIAVARGLLFVPTTDRLFAFDWPGR